MTDQNNAAQATGQPLPSYGKLPFDQLGRDVTEATMGVRQPFDFGPNYPGHAMCLINFDSLARIVDKYRLPEASAPVAGEARAFVYPPDGTESPFTVINLGSGAVQMGPCLHDGRIGGLWFGKDGKGMGHEQVLGRHAHPGETIAVVTFANVEGLDVMLGELLRCREQYFPDAKAAPQASEAVRNLFPAHLRKMWSGGQVQDWLDEHQGITAPKPSAKGSLERYRKWQAEQTEARNSGIEQAAAWVDKRRHDFDQAHGHMESDTGAWSFGCGDGATAKEEYSAELAEIAEGLRALKTQADRDDRRRPQEASDER